MRRGRRGGEIRAREQEKSVEERRREEEEEDGAFSRGGIAEEVQTSICITGIYRQRVPAWRQNRACPRYVISLDSSSRDGRVWRSLEVGRVGRWKIRTERDGGRWWLGRRGGCGGSLYSAHVAGKERTRCSKKPARREKSVGASTQRPMTSSELFASLESFSRQKCCSLSLFRCTSLSLIFYLSFDTFHSFRLLDQTRAGSRIQENRMFDRTCRCNILRLQDQHSIVIL